MRASQEDERAFQTTPQDAWTAGVGVFFLLPMVAVLAIFCARVADKSLRSLSEIFPALLIIGGLSGVACLLLLYRGMRNVVVVGDGTVRVLCDGEIVAERRLSNYLRCYQRRTLEASNWIAFKGEPDLAMPSIVLWRLLALKKHLDRLKDVGKLGEADEPASREIVIP